MGFKKNVFKFFVIFFSIFLIFACWRNTHSTEIFTNINESFPELKLPLLEKENAYLTNQTFKGHVSLLNIWASWCSICQKEHKMLIEIKERYHIPIYGLLYSDSPDHAKEWLTTAGNPYTAIGIDINDGLTQFLNVYGVPETFIIDKEGIIRYRFSGPITEKAWLTILLPIIEKYS